jgi:hypothetical protein
MLKLLRRNVSEFPLRSLSLLNQGVKFFDLVPHYHTAGIFAFPSVCEEACLLPPIEAMASGSLSSLHTRRPLSGARRKWPQRLAC